MKEARVGEISYDISYMCNIKRNDTNELTKQKETQRLREQTYGWQQGYKWWEGIVREFGMDMRTLLYLKWITNKDLLYRTGNSVHCYVAAWMGGEFGGRMDMCICMAESLCCPPETIITLLTGYSPI